MFTRTGLRFQEEGDYLTALPWFAQPVAGE
jgi:hypothetical protein